MSIYPWSVLGGGECDVDAILGGCRGGLVERFFGVCICQVELHIDEVVLEVMSRTR